MNRLVRQLSLVTTWLMACLLAGCASTADPPESVFGSERSAILGGQLDTTDKAVVALRHDSAVCSGTIVQTSDDAAWILTAGHCVVALNEQGEVQDPVEVLEPARITVTLGDDYERDLREGRSLSGSEIRIAPGYDAFAGNPNDIALLKVQGDVANLPYLPILEPATDDIAKGESVTLVGFGRAETPGNTQRLSTEHTVGWVDERFVGFDQSNGTGVCSGDSGGPVLVTRNNQPLVAAVNSIATGTADSPCSKASTATRIARFSELVARATTNSESTMPARTAASCAASPTTPAGSDPNALLGLALALMIRRRRRPQAAGSGLAPPGSTARLPAPD